MMAKNFPRFLCKQAGKLVSIKSLTKIQTPVFLPFYHVVSNEKLPHILNYHYRNVAQFEKELDFYLQYFSPVSLADLLRPIKLNKKPFHLTFDDGLKECAEVIAPILLKKGIPATFFINTGFVDNKALFHKYKASLIYSEIHKKQDRKAIELLSQNGLIGENILNVSFKQEHILDEVANVIGIDFLEFLKNEKPYLTTGQLKDLKQKGFTIGAHGSGHPEFWELTEEEQKTEITTSIDWVKKHLNPQIKSFAFPFTDFGVSDRVIKSVHENNACDVSFGTAGIKYDELTNHFQRYPVENSIDFVGDLKSELVYYQLRKMAGKATVTH